MSNPSDRQAVMDDIEEVAKGGEVLPFGAGIAWVWDASRPIDASASQLVYHHDWYVGGVYPNWEAEEVSLFAFPLD